MVKVPNFAELTVSRVQNLAYSNKKMARYLPDYNEKRSLNREYLFNVRLLMIMTHEDCEHSGPRFLSAECS